MPKGFDNCVKRGGKVRTMKRSGGRHQRICFINGKSFPGEIKKTKSKKKQKKSNNN